MCAVPMAPEEAERPSTGAMSPTPGPPRAPPRPAPRYTPFMLVKWIAQTGFMSSTISEYRLA